MTSFLLQVAVDDVTQYKTRTHMGVVHPLRDKGGSYPLGVVVPPLWLKTSSNM